MNCLEQIFENKVFLKYFHVTESVCDWLSDYCRHMPLNIVWKIQSIFACAGYFLFLGIFVIISYSFAYNKELTFLFP